MNQKKLFIVEIKDNRDKYLISLLKGLGLETCIFGRECKLGKSHIYLMSLTSAVSVDVINGLKSPSILFARDLDECQIAAAKNKNIEYFNYFSDEDLIIKNALLTAEGTLKYIIENTVETIVGMKVLVIGYGRVGKAVTKLLKDNHFDVTVANRNQKVLAESLIIADKSCPLQTFTNEIDKYKVIINTVPHLILEGEALKNIDKEAFVLDLASKPGGVDFEALKRLNIKHLHALGIPGIVAPKTAASFIADFVLKQLKITDNEK